MKKKAYEKKIEFSYKQCRQFSHKMKKQKLKEKE